MSVKKKVGDKSVHIQFRIKEDVYNERFKPIIEAAGMNRSEFFRWYIVNKFEKTEPCVPVNNVERKKERKRLVFLFNKASNNLNQIAKSINFGRKAGLLNEARYLKAINFLSDIEASMTRALDDKE